MRKLKSEEQPLEKQAKSSFKAASCIFQTWAFFCCSYLIPIQLRMIWKSWNPQYSTHVGNELQEITAAAGSFSLSLSYSSFNNWHQPSGNANFVSQTLGRNSPRKRIHSLHFARILMCHATLSYSVTVLVGGTDYVNFLVPRHSLRQTHSSARVPRHHS